MRTKLLFIYLPCVEAHNKNGHDNCKLSKRVGFTGAVCRRRWSLAGESVCVNIVMD